MVLVIIVAIIGVIVLAGVFFKSLKKELHITLPYDSPSDDPYLTDPAFSAFGDNSSHLIFWDRPDE
jgi:hypothetical protein